MNFRLTEYFLSEPCWDIWIANISSAYPIHPTMVMSGKLSRFIITEMLGLLHTFCRSEIISQNKLAMRHGNIQLAPLFSMLSL